MRRLTIRWVDLDAAWESPSPEITGYIDLETGRVASVDAESRNELEALMEEIGPDASIDEILAKADGHDWQKEALREAWEVDEKAAFIPLPERDGAMEHRAVREFISTVRDGALSRQLEEAVRGRGAFRRFRQVLDGAFRERQQWFDFREEWKRQWMTGWLAEQGVEVDWVLPQRIVQPPVRAHLLQGVLTFVRSARSMEGVGRVALLGSLTREEPEPKDADMLVTVSDDMDLSELAKAGRKLAGHAQQRNRGADVFLASARGEYLGRTCHWRICAPGIRLSCDALHCGQRHYLHDDLRSVSLDRPLIAAPPITLWPTLQSFVPVPEDVESILLQPLRSGR